MFNAPALLMGSQKKAPQAVFSLQTPWLYNDEDYCGNPMHEGQHENGSGASGPCGGAFYLELLDASGNTVAELKNRERYETDPYEMFEGTWGEFYESARTFYEPIALTVSSDSSTPIRTIKFNLRFGDYERYTAVTRENFEQADKMGSLRMTIETSTKTYQLVRNSAIWCFLSGLSSECGVLTIRNMHEEEIDLSVNIPETVSICYKDIKNIYIAVTAGIVAILLPPTQEIV